MAPPTGRRRNGYPERFTDVVRQVTAFADTLLNGDAATRTWMRRPSPAVTALGDLQGLRDATPGPAHYETVSDHVASYQLVRGRGTSITVPIRSDRRPSPPRTPPPCPSSRPRRRPRPRFRRCPQLPRSPPRPTLLTQGYTLTGRLATATTPDATLLLEHDLAGRLLSETVNDRTTVYEYDLLGRRTQRTTPTGATSRWCYDAADRRTLLNSGGHRIGFAYDAGGRELSRLIDTTTTLAHTFDDRGRLTSQHVRDTAGEDIQRRRRTYRADNSLIRLDDRLNRTRHFVLDAAGRVTAVHTADWTETLRLRRGRQPDPTPPGPPPNPATRPPAPAPTPAPASPAPETSATNTTRAGRITLPPEDPPVPQARHLALHLGRRGPPHLRHHPRRHRWRYLYDPFGRRTAKQRLAADGATVVEQTRLHLGRRHPRANRPPPQPGLPHPVTLTWDHQGLRPRRPDRARSPTPTTQGEIDQRFFAIVTDLVGTPTELVDEIRRHRLAHTHHPLGHHDLDRPTAPPTPRCASPASTSTRKPASTTTTTALRPRDRPLPHPRPPRPGAGSQPLHLRPQPAHLERPAGARPTLRRRPHQRLPQADRSPAEQAHPHRRGRLGDHHRQGSAVRQPERGHRPHGPVPW